MALRTAIFVDSREIGVHAHGHQWVGVEAIGQSTNA